MQGQTSDGQNTKILLQTVGPQIHDRASQQSGSLSLQPTVFFAFASKNIADVCSLGCILCMQTRKADVLQCILFYSIIANETVCTAQKLCLFCKKKKKKIFRRANHHVGGDAVHVLDLSVISPEHVWKLYFTERKQPQDRLKLVTVDPRLLLPFRINRSK